jgi:alpha-L-rhamnosidase
MPSKQRKWSAKWIWSPDGRYTNAHVLFRRDFDATTPAVANCYIAVETFARVYLNGAEVCRTSSVSYPGQQNYQTIDLRPHLLQGRNELAVLAWYAGIGCTSTMLKDPGLLCEIEVGDQRIGTDDQWRCLTLKAWSGEARSYQFNLDLQEILDYRLLPEGFPSPDDSDVFRTPTVLLWPGVRMGVVEERDFPMLVSEGEASLTLVSASLVGDRSGDEPIPAAAVAAEELLSPVDAGGAITPPPAGHAVALVYDLAGYHIGTPHITVDAPSGTVVDLSWSEALKAGHVDMFGKTYTTDRYILRDGVTTITPEEWKAGKFLQLTLRRFDRPITVTPRFAIERYPLTRRTTFKSSDERLNRIVDISLRAVQMCMHDRIMDCPYRERRVWIGDAQRIGLINYYAFDDQKLIRHTLKQQARLQDPTGRVWVCIPLMEEFPTQSMEWVRAILEYQQYTGDVSLVEDLRDNIEWLHRWFLKCRDDRGLFFNPNPPVCNWEDNTLTGLTLKHQFRTPLLASNLRYLMFLDDIADLVPAAAGQAKSERRKLERLIVDRFLDRSTNLLREFADLDLDPIFAEYNAALAVNADLPDFDAAAHFDRTLAHPAVIAASPFGKFQTFEAFGKLGRADDIVKHIYAGWGPMVDAGSDTAWEWFPPRVSSYCHGWSGIPIVALLRHVLKLHPRKPERRRVENIAGVAWIESGPV